MTSEEIKSIEDIKGTAGFRVIEFVVNKNIEELDSVRTLDLHSTVSVDLQALARKLAVEWLENLLKEINLNPVSIKEKRRTYE